LESTRRRVVQRPYRTLAGSSFFFQAEDGIRDFHVTGVQTCALPISTDVMSFPMDELRPGTAGAPGENGILGDIVICPSVAEAQRSEERRVGKECRSRGAADD